MTDTVLEILVAKVRTLEQQLADIEDQNRKNLSRVDKLLEALVRHHCKDPRFHLRSLDKKDSPPLAFPIQESIQEALHD